MARRSDHSREELHEMILGAAGTCVEREGAAGIDARRIAAEIGYSPGTIYNLFTGLDDVALQLNARTLDALHDAVSDGPLPERPEAALAVLAQRYIGFAHAHPRLWALLVEHRPADGRAPPADYHARIDRLLALVEGVLAPVFAAYEKAECRRSARVLWSALHGILSLEAGGKLAQGESVDTLAAALIRHYVAGLRALG
jgi:AcrR family transcriptional regulator